MLIFLPAAARAQGSFELGIEGPDSICGSPGTEQSAPFYCTLTSSGNLRARGWTFGVTADNAAITSITTAGTAVEELYDEGFQKIEITSGEGNEGAVAAVVLSLNRAITLPANTKQRIAVIGVEVAIPAAIGSAGLRYVNGLAGAGEPVITSIADQDGIDRTPSLRAKTIRLPPDTLEPCDPVNPLGWIRTAGWNMLFPLTNPDGCDGGGAANMQRNWLAPHSLASETPLVGEEWGDIDFRGTAVAEGFDAETFYAALGRSGDPVWVSLDFLHDALPDVNIPNQDVVSYQGILDLLNAVAVPPLGIPRIFSDQVLAVAQTYVENTTGSGLCVNVCTGSTDSIQVWVNDNLVTNVSSCRRLGTDCSELSPAVLEPGINKISVLSWEGRGAWGFKLGLENAEMRAKLSNANQAAIVFRGPQPGGQVAQPSQLVVTRAASNPDGCPVAATRVTLTGNGHGAGVIKVTETYPAENLTAASFTNISHAGALTAIGDDGEGHPELYRITWNVAADALNAGGIHYDINLPGGTASEPAGVVADCARVAGISRVEGSRAHTGPLGVFDDSHDIGTAADIAGGAGSVAAAPGGDGVLGTLDDVYVLRGSGKDIGDGGDSFHFAYKRLRGDFSATIRVAGRTFPASGGRRSPYGLMARLDCSKNSRYSLAHANLEANPGPGADHPRGDAVFWQFRQDHHVDGTNNANQFFIFPDPDGGGPNLENQPNYFRLDRRGSIFYGYASFDAVDWRLVGSDTWDGLGLNDEILVGAVYSKGVTVPASGSISFTEFRCGPPSRAELFDNDSGLPGTIVFESNFNGVPNGGLPPGLQGNSSGGAGGGAAAAGNHVNQNPDGAGAGGGGFTPHVVNGRLRLTQEGITNTATSVFLTTPVPTGAGQIIVEYTVYMSHSGVTGQPVTGDPNPGYGLTMTLLAGTDTHRVGGPSGDMGYGGIAQSFGEAAPSFSVEADTWSADAFNEGTGSPNNDGSWHLAINTGGNVRSIVLKSSGLPDIFSPQGVRFRVVITLGGKVSVFILDGEGGGAGVQGDPVIEGQGAPLGDQGDTEAVVGVTGGTGDGSETGEVDDICVTVVECTDQQEVATIAGPTTAGPDQVIELDATQSNAGPGDAAETSGLSFQWTVSGGGSIQGPNDQPTVSIITPGDGDVIVRVDVDDGHCTNLAAAQHTIHVEATNWPTYDNNTDGTFNISDPVSHLNFLFLGGPAPGCIDASDFNQDGTENITDPVAALNHLFLGGPPPPKGTGCRNYPSCGTAGACQ